MTLRRIVSERATFSPALRAAFVVMALAAAARGAEIPQGNLIGFWRFDEVRDRSIVDRSTNGNVLRLESAAVLEEQDGGRSLRCAGLETAAQLDERTPLAWRKGLTLAVWVRPERQTRSEPLVGRPHANTNYTTPVTGLFLSEQCPTFGMLESKGKLLLVGPEIPLRIWTFVAVTLDGQRARLWVDGRAVAESPQKFAIPAGGSLPWYVGRSQAQYFRGWIGEVLAWSRPLGADEIQQLHEVTAGRYASAQPAQLATRWPDRTVQVESPGNLPDGTWRGRATRTLEGLDRFQRPKPVALDAYGGRLDAPALAATGFFRTQRIDGRWWLITPEGHRYWNVALNHVAPETKTKAPDAASFAATITRDLRELGFTGLGTTSMAELRQAPAPLPWCIRLNFAASFARERGKTYATAGHAGFAEQCMPVFHPDFAPWAERYAERLKATADDPFALGIFTDNELQCSVDLLDRHLRLDAADPYLRPGREAALAWLRQRHRPADPAALTLKDRFEFIACVFGTYSRIVHDAVRKHDRHHLIIGSRFFAQIGQFNNPAFWAAVGPWVDVASINYYGHWGVNVDELEEWSAGAQRPLLISEWYSKAMDASGLANTHGAGWLVRTQEERGLYYQHFALSALECRALVGFHYFKFMDDPAESKALDAVGGANKGMFHIDGRPWLPLTQRAQAVNTALYPLLDFFATRTARTAGNTPVTKAGRNPNILPNSAERRLLPSAP